MDKQALYKSLTYIFLPVVILINLVGNLLLEPQLIHLTTHHAHHRYDVMLDGPITIFVVSIIVAIILSLISYLLLRSAHMGQNTKLIRDLLNSLNSSNPEKSIQALSAQYKNRELEDISQLLLSGIHHLKKEERIKNENFLKHKFQHEKMIASTPAKKQAQKKTTVTESKPAQTSTEKSPSKTTDIIPQTDEIISLPAVEEAIAAANNILVDFCQRAQVPGKQEADAVLCLDEHLKYILEQAQTTKAEIQVQIKLQVSKEALILIITDSGPANDPTLALTKAESGDGSGIHRIHRLSSDLHYERRGEKNRMEIKINLSH